MIETISYNAVQFLYSEITRTFCSKVNGNWNISAAVKYKTRTLQTDYIADTSKLRLPVVFH